MEAHTPAQRMEAAELALGVASSHVMALGARAQARGQGAWLVGGGVRDLLLGEPIHDVDLVFDGDVLSWAPQLVAELGGALLQHGAFHTATWVVDGLHIDLISARSERYPHPGSLPEVALGSLEEDLARRDFSVNAMALAVHPSGAGELVDPQGGQEDLRAGLLRVLHPRSFQDDPTRALRGARYAARLNLDLHPQTRAALDAARADFPLLGLERLGKELGRVFEEQRVEEAVTRLDAWGALSAFDARLGGSGARLQQTLARGRQLALDVPAATLAWVALGQHLGAARGALEALVRSDGALLALWRHPGLDPNTLGEEPGAWGAALSGLPEPLLATVEHPAAEWWAYTGRHLTRAVDAAQLMAAGMARGPELGAALRRAQASAWRGQPPDLQLQEALEGPLR